jgi:single stranded DNA-binding protein|tara:strand:+ start:25 stop:429 length:405 start_codon:yes stop_codon:yes gene_type:complete
MNAINVRGNLTRDVKITETSKGLFVLKGTIADNYGWSNKDEGQNKVNWINFTRFLRKQPTEGFVQRLQKGAFVIIDGRLETSKREVDGVTYNNLDVIVNNIEAPFPPRDKTGDSVSTSTEAKPPAKGSNTDLPF